MAKATQETKAATTQEFESLVLVSPSGHKYEVCISDSGNLSVTFKKEVKEVKAHADETSGQPAV